MGLTNLQAAKREVYGTVAALVKTRIALEGDPLVIVEYERMLSALQAAVNAIDASALSEDEVECLTAQVESLERRLVPKP